MFQKSRCFQLTENECKYRKEDRPSRVFRQEIVPNLTDMFVLLGLLDSNSKFTYQK